MPIKHYKIVIDRRRPKKRVICTLRFCSRMEPGRWGLERECDHLVLTRGVGGIRAGCAKFGGDLGQDASGSRWKRCRKCRTTT
jgi:hypothetical protein